MRAYFQNKGMTLHPSASSRSTCFMPQTHQYSWALRERIGLTAHPYSSVPAGDCRLISAWEKMLYRVASLLEMRLKQAAVLSLHYSEPSPALSKPVMYLFLHELFISSLAYTLCTIIYFKLFFKTLLSWKRTVFYTGLVVPAWYLRRSCKMVWSLSCRHFNANGTCQQRLYAKISAQ